METVDKKIADLKKELEGGFVTDEKLQALAAKVDALTAEVVKLIGHRLTSLALIPTQHINGIAAMTFTTLQYTPQKYEAMPTHTSDPSGHTNRPVLDHKDAGTARYIATEKNKAYFHVSPSVGVRTQDILTPSFDCIKSENIMTKNADGTTITNNSPIEVTGHNIDKEGVLEVTFKKHSDFLGQQLSTTKEGNKEKFYMASLKAPISAETIQKTKLRMLKLVLLMAFM